MNGSVISQRPQSIATAERTGSTNHVDAAVPKGFTLRERQTRKGPIADFSRNENQHVGPRLSGEQCTRLRYFCSPHDEDSALYSSITWLEQAAGLRREDTDQQRLDKFEAVLIQGINDLSELLVCLVLLASVSPQQWLACLIGHIIMSIG